MVPGGNQSGKAQPETGMANLANSQLSRGAQGVSGGGGRPNLHAQPLPWPDDLLTSFSLRMSSHGMSISRVEMQGDIGYALQQLSHALDMDDPPLSLMAEELFRWFESHQYGLWGPAH
jgi:hypothetical protein